MTAITRTRTIFVSCAAAAIALVLAACGHGASGVAQGPGQSHRGVQQVQFKITVPTPGPSFSRSGVHHHRRKHGHCCNGRSTRIYAVWRSMMQRCNSPNHPAYADYGGRGIRVCERWHSFVNFLVDMGEPPPGLSIDRINNDGDYEPGNCRWATRSEQMRNRRPRKKSKLRIKLNDQKILAGLKQLNESMARARGLAP